MHPPPHPPPHRTPPHPTVTKHMDLALAPHGITCVALHPGSTCTARLAGGLINVGGGGGELGSCRGGARPASQAGAFWQRSPSNAPCQPRLAVHVRVQAMSRQTSTKGRAILRLRKAREASWEVFRLAGGAGDRRSAAAGLCPLPAAAALCGRPAAGDACAARWHLPPAAVPELVVPANGTADAPCLLLQCWRVARSCTAASMHGTAPSCHGDGGSSVELC